MATLDELLEAVKVRDLEAVQHIAASDPHLAAACAPGGASALLWAAYTGFGEAVSVLAAAHPGMSLGEAAALGDQARVEDRLAATPEALSAPGPDGWTPLHLAVFFGRDAVARRLILAGADVQAFSTNAVGNQPLHAAIAGEQALELVHALLEAGADVNAVAAGGVTPLHLAAAYGHDELVAVLRAHGASTVAKTENGLTPAAMAADRGHLGLAAALA